MAPEPRDAALLWLGLASIQLPLPEQQCQVPRKLRLVGICNPGVSANQCLVMSLTSSKLMDVYVMAVDNIHNN